MKFRKTARVGALISTLVLATCVFAYPTVFPTGVTINEPGVSEGYFVIANGPVVYLMDADGTQLHSWTPQSGWTYVTRPIDNGHLLVKTTVNPGVYAIVELDWDSHVVWFFVEPPPGFPPETELHHDWIRLDNGNTMILARYPGLYPQISYRTVLNDFIIEVAPTGEIVWEWYTSDHFDEFGFTQERKDFIYDNGSDWSHINSVSVIPPNSLGDPRFTPGNLIVSYRYQGIAVIDRATSEIVWFNGDATIGQHDAAVIPENFPGGGNILTFDNGWAGKWVLNYNRTHSRILEIDPITEEIVYEYNAESSNLPLWTFFAPQGSGVQRLPGGNTLICETTSGRVFEITPAGDIVWEYIHPTRNPNNFNANNLYRAYKVPLDWASSYFTPDLVVSMSGDADPVAGGTTLQYTIQVDSRGVHPAVNASLNQAMPTGTRFQSISTPPGWDCATPPVGSAGSIACTTSSMSAGSTAQFTLEVSVDPCVVDGTVISSTATVTSDGTDATPGDNSVAVGTAVGDTTCDDGSLCTVDACAADNAACDFEPLDCIPDELCRDSGVCDPATGMCSFSVSANGTGCDDGDPSTCADSCTDGLCSGPVVPPPPEVGDSVRLFRAAGVTTISWDGPSGQFNVYEGVIATGALFVYNHVCMNPGGPITDRSTTAPGVPASGQAAYYLVTRVDQCRDSGCGSSSAGVPRPIPFPCTTA